MTSPSPPSPFPEDVISGLLQRLVRSAGLLEPHDHAGVRASLSEVMALRELSATSGLTQAELGAALALEKSTVSRLVAGMEQRGWVSRERDPANRRFVRLRLTSAGTDVAARIGAYLAERHREMLSALAAEELTALSVGLTALARAIGPQHRHQPADRPAEQQHRHQPADRPAEQQQPHQPADRPAEQQQPEQQPGQRAGR